MQAIRVHPAPASSSPYSPTNPAPSSALRLDHNVPVPKPSKRGELLVFVKATTVIRDMLTWPETYSHEFAILGNDLSGIVTEVFSEDCRFKPGDEVFGMAHTERASAWAEYCIVKDDEIALKPKDFTWGQAAALPLSAQTAYEALFNHAGVPVPVPEDSIRNKSRAPSVNRHTVLITGAAGGVGVYLVQLASIAGLRTVAATSSNARDEKFLRGLGADEAIDYNTLEFHKGAYDIVIDTVGGDVLARCWNYVKEGGMLISVDSASYNFVEDHKTRGIRKEGVRALFFIVEPNSKALRTLAELADLGILQSFVLETYPLARAQRAYDHANGRYSGRGKILLAV